MSQPMDRNAKHEPLGELDEEAEFWVENPFQIASGGYNLSAYERNRLFLNLDGESFIDASFASKADIDSDSRSVVAADFDRDGAPDLLVASVGGGPLRLFLNRFPPNGRRVLLELIGVESNRSAIGSRVVAESGGRKIIRDLFPANGGTGQAPPELLPGVGDVEQIETLTVRWPSGRTQTFRHLPVDSRITITEGQDEVAVTDLVKRNAEKTASN